MFRAALILAGMDRETQGNALVDEGFALLLGLLTAWNERVLAARLAAGERLPWIDDLGVRYVAEPPPRELWLDVLELRARGEGDCEDLACAEAAMWRVYRGVQARPAFTRRPVVIEGFGPVMLFHCFVRLPDGRISDPSRRLGMSPIS